MRYSLKAVRDQTMVITGASSGIGLATSLEAARRGAQVVLVSRNEAELKTISERTMSKFSELRPLRSRSAAGSIPG
jgi:short-subunit dehydrogenase